MNRAVVLREAQAFADAGRFVEALALCDTLLRDQEEASALRVKGLALGGLLRKDEAAAALRRACELAPEDGACFAALGSALRALGRSAEALAAFDKAARLSPKDAETLHLRGGLRLQLGDEAGAVADFKASARLMPESEQKRKLLAMIEAEERRQASPGGDAAELARAAYETGAFETALETLGALGPGTQGLPRLLHLKALCLIGLARDAEARRVLKDPLLSAATTPAMLLELGRAFAARGRHEDALEQYDAALRAAPREAEALSARAESLRASGRAPDALADVDAALKIRPEDEELAFTRLELLLELGRDGQAEAERLSKRGPAARERAQAALFLGGQAARLRRALDFWLVEDFDKGLKLCDELLGEDPAQAAALCWKGIFLFGLKRFADARKALSEAFRRSPEAIKTARAAGLGPGDDEGGRLLRELGL